MTTIAGALTALYLLSGRWSLSRLAPEVAGRAPYLEVRLWVVALLAAAALLVARGGEPARRSYAPAATAAFLVWMALSAAWAPDAELASRKMYEVLLVLVATASIARIVSRGDASAFLVAFWGTVLVAAGALAAVALPSVVARGAAGERLAVLAGGPNVFARILGFLALAALFFWRRSGRAWLWMPIVALAFVLVLLTGSRGGLVAVVVAVAVFVVLEVRDPRRLVPAVALAGGLFFAAASYTAPGRAALDAYERRVKVLLLTDRYTAGRTELYRSAYELGRTAPVAGRGLAAFPARGLGVYPHNLFLEVFCEAGILGVALLLLALATGGAALLRRGGARDGATIAGLTLLFVSSQFSGDLYDSRGVFALLVLTSFTPVAEAAGGEEREELAPAEA